MQQVVQILTLAFIVVIASVGLMIPIMLYVFNLRASGWTWQYCGLFVSMLASTDAVAIISTMKTSALPACMSDVQCTGIVKRHIEWMISHPCVSCLTGLHGVSGQACDQGCWLSSVLNAPQVWQKRLCLPGRGASIRLFGPGRSGAHAALHQGTLDTASCTHLTCELLKLCGAAGGGPERLRLLMEGESLLNDASGITLFTIFLEHVEDLIQGTEGHNTFWSVFGDIVGRTAWLGIGVRFASV